MGIEYELKFQANPQQLEQLRSAFTGAQTVFHMHTTYYDTPTGQLSARRYTLRCRQENHRSVCTIKAPAGGLARGEWDTECERIEDAIPILCKLGAPEELPALAAEGLLPICGAKFTRIAVEVVQPEFTAELALDQGVLMGGGRQIPLCEAELELKSGDQAQMTLFARQLAALYGLVPERQSKFRRAQRLYKGE